MATITAICNQKGGVGKTVTAVSLGIGLVRAGKKVLLVDVDSQGSLTASLGYQRPDLMKNTLAEILGRIIMDKPVTPGEGILHQTEGVDLVPANIELSGLEVTLVNTMSRETVLREYLNSVRDQYDVILLDCCPFLGMLTINALAAADEVVITVKETKTVDGYVLDGQPQTITIKEGEAQSLTFWNKKAGGLIVNKIDAVTKKPLAGVKFKILDAYLRQTGRNKQRGSDALHPKRSAPLPSAAAQGGYG